MWPTAFWSLCTSGGLKAASTKHHIRASQTPEFQMFWDLMHVDFHHTDQLWFFYSSKPFFHELRFRSKTMTFHLCSGHSVTRCYSAPYYSLYTSHIHSTDFWECAGGTLWLVTHYSVTYKPPAELFFICTMNYWRDLEVQDVRRAGLLWKAPCFHAGV